MKTETHMQIEHLLDSVEYNADTRSWSIKKTAEDQATFNNAINWLMDWYEPEDSEQRIMTLDQIEAMEEIAIEMKQRDHFGG